MIATKVSQHPEYLGLAPANIRAALDASLRRLGVEVIDLYYAHFDDQDTPLEETIATLSELVDEGKVRYLGVSNYSAERLEEWVRITEAGGFHPPIALQQAYSLVERGVEQTTLPVSRREGWTFLPYYALASGFLTGKYASGQPVDSPRAGNASAYLTGQGRRILATMEDNIGGPRGRAAGRGAGVAGEPTRCGRGDRRRPEPGAAGGAGRFPGTRRLRMTSWVLWRRSPGSCRTPA